MSTEIVMYCNCMEEVKHRISLVQSVLAGSITTGHHAFDAELIFLQLRKTLELIAFGSLTANKAEYSAAHEKFATHWNAERVLRDLERINPDFYPVPLEQPQTAENGVKHFPRPTEGFMTKDEFISLYDKCGKILHARNPFTTEGSVVQIGYSVEQWVSRIQKLLQWHLMHLVNGNKWIVTIPNDDKVQVWPATPFVNG